MRFVSALAAIVGVAAGVLVVAALLGATPLPASVAVRSAVAAAAAAPLPHMARPPLTLGEPWPSVLVLLALGGMTLGWSLAARRGVPLPRIRAFPAMVAIEEAVGRATELGRPVHFTGGIEDTRSPQTVAAFAALKHTARLCARYRTPLLATSADATVQAVNEAVVRRAFADAGVPERYNPDDVRYLSDSQFAYAGAITGIFRRERPAANVLFGAFNAEAMVLIEAGAEAGAMQVGATANPYQLPFVVAGCDHALIGEEMFAASAALSGDGDQHAAIVAQDWAKVGILAIVVAGAVLGLVDPAARAVLTAVGGG